MRSLVAVLFAICLISVTLVAGPKTKLRIEVKNHLGKPVDRAAVVINVDRGRSVVKLGKKDITHYELRTNQEGVAAVPVSLPQGKIRVQIIAKGYQTFGEVFDIAEEEKTIDIKLNPPQPQETVHQ